MSIDLKSLEEMLRQLADGPEEVRKATLKVRLEELTAMPEDQRREVIRMSMLALSRLDRLRRRTIVKARLEVFAGLPAGQRKTILMSRRAAMSDMADLDKDDMSLIEEVLPELPEQVRNTLTQEIQGPVPSIGSGTQPPSGTPYGQGMYGQRLAGVPYGPPFMPAYFPPFAPLPYAFPPPFWFPPPFIPPPWFY